MPNKSMLKRSLFFVCSFVLLQLTQGCAVKPELHIYGAYLSQAEEQHIAKEAQALGFSPIINELDFPSTIQTSSLIYSPGLTTTINIDQLLTSLNDMGLPIESVETFVAGNHWYTSNAIALLTYGKDNQSGHPVKSYDLAKTYRSRACAITRGLTLFRDGSYTISGESWTPAQLLLSKGTWEYRQYPYIELRPEKGLGWYQYYEIKTDIEQDNVSEIEMLSLVPLDQYELVEGCTFINGIRLNK